ncbi:Ion-translocating oxidoreductase complex subunit G [Petrocella atlantisensis]|uniref:Ion-translocating oxidoreductase complex subunit G n=1 Tax=Petrocella atlantisensis TaxID=2173034 RepID=A0A3P7RSG3_9FIRM|nr:RnfABCDGE type electron transport complex subunit G [Petrocella atlantisensis]PKM54493.1 MAG: electron transporter RnfG [Firmicutes bacterium HGW-Firmicutes-5]VDN45952.1 Ion-translocating oxidoreductase complex subunit G [Petrocella atlantisensis]
MAKQTDNIIKNAMILFMITVIAGTLLGLTYEVTKEPIRIQQEKLKNNALKAVVIGASDFVLVDLEEEAKEQGIQNLYEATKDGAVVGYAFEMTATEGYGGDIALMVGIGIDDQILGIDVIKHNETPGLGAKITEQPFKSEFEGQPTAPLAVIKGAATGNPGEIASISGATITSASVTNAVNVATQYYTDNMAGVK